MLILGAGMVGLTAAAAARTAGAVGVVVADRQSKRVDLALKFGATHSVHVNDALTPLATVVAEAADGRGADVVLELSGAAVRPVS